MAKCDYCKYKYTSCDDGFTYPEDGCEEFICDPDIFSDDVMSKLVDLFLKLKELSGCLDE